MRKIVVAGVSALSIAAGSAGLAAVVPAGLAFAQDGSTTTTAPPTAPAAPGRATPHPGKILDDVLKALVADGTITQEQADKITAKAGEAAAAARDKAQAKRGEIKAELGATLDEIATYLGTTTADLKEQLKTKSLGEIAGDKKPGLITMLTDKANARIDKAVTDGKLTADQAAKLKASTADRITKLVDHAGGGGLKGLGGKLGGMRRPGGR